MIYYTVLYYAILYLSGTVADLSEEYDDGIHVDWDRQEDYRKRLSRSRRSQDHQDYDWRGEGGGGGGDELTTAAKAPACDLPNSCLHMNRQSPITVGNSVHTIKAHQLT